MAKLLYFCTSMTKKIAAIIVTFNGEKWIRKCLTSLLEGSLVPDIFVLDNQSTDATVSILREFPVQFEISDHNSGFGFANNILLTKTLQQDYDYFFLVNQDVYVEKETVQQLIEFAEDHQEAGIIAPIQFDESGKNVDVNFADYLQKSTDKGKYFETTFVNAAAWMLPKKCIKKVGIFSPHFRHYGEDRNYAERTLFHQFKILVPKEIRVIHDREQKMSLEKAIKLAKIKLLTIFLNPNFTQKQSIMMGFTNALGISKYILKKHQSLRAFPILMEKYLQLLKKKNFWENEKAKMK